MPWNISTLPGAIILPGSIPQSALSPGITARTLGGITTTIAPTAPLNPNPGDIWIDSANGYQISQYETSWQAISWTASDVLVAGTISAALLEVGIIVAGIVNGTQIQGASFVADGTTGEVLVYSSSPPAHGNLIASVSPVAGTDGHSNNYVDTFAAYGPNGGTVQVAVNQTSGQPYIIFRPANGVSINSGVWPQVYGTVNNGGAANEYPTLWLIGGAEPNPGTGAQTYIQVTGEANDSSTVGVIQHFIDGHNIFGITTAYMQAYQPLLATDPSSGSFETWHSVALPFGWSGTIRVKKLAEGNFACMDINCSFVDSSTGTSYNAGNLPSASYYPTTRTQEPLTVNQGVGTSPTLPRVNIPTSGAIQIDMPGFAVNGQTCLVFGTVIYPLD